MAKTEKKKKKNSGKVIVQPSKYGTFSHLIVLNIEGSSITILVINFIDAYKNASICGGLGYDWFDFVLVY